MPRPWRARSSRLSGITCSAGSAGAAPWSATGFWVLIAAASLEIEGQRHESALRDLARRRGVEGARLRLLDDATHHPDDDGGVVAARGLAGNVFIAMNQAGELRAQDGSHGE